MNSTYQVFMNIATISLILLLFGGCVSYSKPLTTSEKCLLWQSKVDASMPNSGQNIWQLPDSDAETTQAIECLFRLEGKTGTATFGGAMRYDVSDIIPSAPLEVAAMYYISYLYTGKPEHAAAVALRDSTGEVNRPESIALAWKYYKEWWQKVRKIGLKKSREKHMMPLAGKNVWWYK